MRTLMTFLTLGAGYVGYTYLQQPLSTSEPYSDAAKVKPAFDWNRGIATGVNAIRPSVKELVQQIHDHTRSILDEFGDSQVATNNDHAETAFDRLLQATRPAVATVESPLSQGTNSGVVPVAKTSESSRNSNRESRQSRVKALPPASLAELQRVAFEPSDTIRDVETPAVVESATASANVVVTQPDATKPVEDFPNPVTLGKLEPTPDESPISQSKQAPIASATDSNGTESSSSLSVEAAPAVKQITKSVSNTTVKVEPQWKIVGRTTEGRPLHSMHLGNGGTRTLVIAGLDGEDRFAVRWIEQLADVLKNRPELLATNEIVLFRAGNPDGLVRKTKENSRGIALNRNFPSRLYRPTPGIPATAIPGGEAETRVMLSTLYTFRPRRLVHLTATTTRSQVFFNRLGKEQAVAFEKATKTATWPLDVEQCPGSIEDFADGTLEAAVISLKLNIGTDWQKAWNDFQLPVLSAIVGRPVDDNKASSTIQDDPDRTPIPNATIEPVSRRPRRRGYEELPAPPE